MLGRSLFSAVNSKPLSPCAYCGAVVPGGTDGCRALYERILAQEYSDPAYGAVHLLTVDTYALQHSEEYGSSSNAFHLIRLCWLLELEGDPSVGPEQVLPNIFSDGRSKFPFLKPPVYQGELTITSVQNVKDPKEYAELVKNWAWSVWEAWKPYHEFARQWTGLL